MGHVRLGVLPKSRKWRQVVDELRLGASVGEIAGLAAEAAETSLQAAAGDPAFLHSFWLLTQVPLAARWPVFVEDLGRLGINVTGPPSLMTVVAAISAAVDHHAREHGGRTDLGEMAQMAALESHWNPSGGVTAASVAKWAERMPASSLVLSNNREAN